MRGSVTGRRRPGLSRRPLSLIVGLILAATSLSTADPVGAAGNRPPGGGSGACQTVDGQATCQSGVTFTANGSGITVAAPKDWKPSPCWYEPSFFTPTFLKVVSLLPLIGPVIPLLTGGDTGTNGDYHDGQKGRWWGFVYNPTMPDAMTQCTMSPYPLLEWVPDATPTPPNAVDVWKMAAAAAEVIPVNPPALTLRPGADKQIVNLPTLVSFTNAFPRTWVTARLNVDGYALAATTIATPASITVDAGTSNASPSSCTYTLSPNNGDSQNYQMDANSTHCSAGSSGPNAGIVYRRPTAPGTTYALTATVTWNVTWTNTDSPDSPPQTDHTLGPLTLPTPAIPVTVNEVETVNPTGQ
jgi:hypothetical protein